jgi:hypothetical protein
VLDIVILRRHSNSVADVGSLLVVNFFGSKVTILLLLSGLKNSELLLKNESPCCCMTKWCYIYTEGSNKTVVIKLEQ